MNLIIKNGIVYDPANGITGEKMDIFIKDGKIVEEVREGKIIDASNKLVVPGGVDMHSHIAGGKVNTARVMRPEDIKSSVRVNPGFRAESGYTVPNSYGIGYRYARMGYTTVFEPANPPLSSFHTHEELDAIPMVDKGTLVLSRNNWNVMQFVREKDIEKLKAYMSWLIFKTKSYGIKVVNPGGIEAWAYGKNMRGLDDVVPYFEVTPREIITSLVKANEELSLPHSVHLHCNNLGVPGNYETTIASMKLVRGMENRNRQVLHVTHVQFNAYAGDSWKTFSSGAEEIAKYVNGQDNITIDMGQPVFGSATTMTADAPAQFALHKLTRAKWANMDVELETGSGILPFYYSPKNPVTAVQWAIGLELGLLVKSDRVVLSTDHPNGGPFTAYPHIMAMLMSKKKREEELKKAHAFVGKATSLPSIEVEKSLEEVIQMTRSLPAKILNLPQKGHLGAGADGDVAIYDFNPLDVDPSTEYEKIEKAFSQAEYTIKSGEIIAERGEIRKQIYGKTFWVNSFKQEDWNLIGEDVSKMFKFYSIELSNYGVEESWLKNSNPVEVT